MKSLKKLVLCMLLVTGITNFTSCKTKKEKDNASTEKSTQKTLVEEATKTYAQATATSLCDPSWFPHSQTENPKEGPDSPFAASETKNSIFHQWSWQKFLWLTKPEPSDDPENLPLFLNPKWMHQVDSYLLDVPAQPNATVVLQDSLQAGSSGVLKTNPAFNSVNNKEETVYYSIHVSPKLKAAATKFRRELLDGTLPPDNTASFPVGSLELKVSWVSTDAIPVEERANYFITTGAIQAYKGAPFKNKEVALLGMHVVGVVENHPEFIWATFEHDNLAPNYKRSTDIASNRASSTTQQLLFKAGEVKDLKGITWVKDKGVALPHQAYDLFEYGVPREQDGTFMKTSQDEQTNWENIVKINECVKDNLFSDEDSGPWKHYFYNGSIWADMDNKNHEEQVTILNELGGDLSRAVPKKDSDLPAIARGSLNCANTTMETYTQTYQDDMASISVGNLENCFTCHNANKFHTENNSPLYISHIFNAYVKIGQGKTKNEIEMIKAKHEIEEFIKNKLEK